MEIIPEENEEEPPMTVQDDIDKADTILYTPEKSDDEQFNMAINDTLEHATIVMGKLVTTAFISADICIPTEEVGCSQLLVNLKSSLIIFHQNPEKKLLNRYMRYYKH